MGNGKIDVWQDTNMLWHGREAKSNVTFIGRSKEEVIDKVKNASETTKLFKKRK